MTREVIANAKKWTIAMDNRQLIVDDASGLLQFLWCPCVLTK